MELRIKTDNGQRRTDNGERYALRVGTAAAGRVSGGGAVRPAHFLADVYTFDWTKMEWRLPGVSAAAVGLCLSIGIGCGHPGGGLIAAGGALTVGFGANQRISDSRVLPMLFAVFAMASATLTGTVAGHRGYALLAASAVAAAIYGVLTIRNAGLAWVGQQAAVALFVASAFPMGPRGAFERAGLIVAGGMLQTVMTTAGMRLLPQLEQDLLAIPRTVYVSVMEQRREFLRRVADLPLALPAPDRAAAAAYALRLLVTVVAGSEVYRRMGIQSGYWVPMTALLVQKPAFYETLERGLMRVGGTICGATMATLLVRVLAAHVPFGPWWLAGLTTFFAYWALATISVNYGVFSLFMTSYIVFLLSLNAIPGPEIAHRRAACTAIGAAIAMAFHLDALRRHKETDVSC
jgi:hypothetical protein